MPFAASSRHRRLERARLARELHDETGQALTSILLGLKSLEERVESDDGRSAAIASCASSSSRRCRTSGGWQSSCARPRSTTSGSCRRSSAFATRSPSRSASPSTCSPTLGDRAPACRDRDGALPHRAGGADQRAEARRGEAGDGATEHGAARSVLTSSRTTGGDSTAEACADGGLGLIGHARASRAPRRALDGRVERRRGDDAEGGGPDRVIRVLIVDDHAVVRSGCVGCSTPRPTSRRSARRRTPTARCSRRSRASPTSC